MIAILALMLTASDPNWVQNGNSSIDLRAQNGNLVISRDASKLLSFGPHSWHACTIVAGVHSQLKLTSHGCGCMEIPLAQGRAVLPCLAHEKVLQARWDKVDRGESP